jgi:hypothetical protein
MTKCWQEEFILRCETVDMHAKQKDFLLEFFSMSPPLCYHPNNMSLPKFSVRS